MTLFLLALVFTLPLICSAGISSGCFYFNDKYQAEQLSLKIYSYESASYESFTQAHGLTSTGVIMYSVARCGYCQQAGSVSGELVSAFPNPISRNQSSFRIYAAIATDGVPVMLIMGRFLSGLLLLIPVFTSDTSIVKTLTYFYLKRN